MARPRMQHAPPLAETIESILHEQEPNFLRLYLNPHVAQVCLCLDRYARSTWADGPDGEDYQSFLANSRDEATSGALKLLRCNRARPDVRSTALILDPSDRLTGFASAELAGGGRVEFLPDVRVLGGKLEEIAAASASARIDPLVMVASENRLLDEHAAAIGRIMTRDAPRVITCVDRAALDAVRADPRRLPGLVVPDVIVFDESFVNHAVPFAAFTARRSLFAVWNRPGKGTFHSTTFQPNTISARHFLACLAGADPEFLDHHADALRAVRDDLSRRGEAFQRYYNPSLCRLIRAAGFETAEVRASGSFVVVNGQPVYDVVGGVACSMRGHNPPGYLDETTSPALPAGAELEAELSDRLRSLTGLGRFLPAASGGGAVEAALKLALVAQHPRRHVLALKAGFGGKTLFALTGTANPKYKEGIGPLYPEVHYVDPFAPDACARIDALMKTHAFAVVQLELIQSVGGVRAISESVIRHLDEGRRRHGYLLLVDEVQTGMYRTGPFVRSRAIGLVPDLLLLGKGTSDMMFPFALTLYSDAVAERLDALAPDLVAAIQGRFDDEQGYRTIANLLRLGERIDLTRQVEEAAEVFRAGLAESLSSSRHVREVRAFGLLIGVVLDAGRLPRRWLGKRLAAFVLLAMLRHPRFPVLGGFCQYEPNVLKITPPLDAGPDEIRATCRTIAEVVNTPLWKLLAAGLGGLILPSPIRKKGKYEYADNPAAQLAAR
ncbi:MAG: aminotransferase class III-fold pyridoxal phosphate-dependent enzyme [Isosphaeraceae bacterium]